MLILFSRSQGEEVALARAHGVVDLCSSDCIKGSEIRRDAAATITAADLLLLL